LKLKKSIQKLASGDPLKIIAIGDSLTQGWMVRKGYLDFIAEMLRADFPKSNVTILNRGIPGDTAQGGLFRLREDVLDCDPDLVFIQFALNDAFTGVPPVQFKNTVRTMVDHIRADTDAEILLVTSVPIMHQDQDFMAENFYSRLIELSREENLPIAPVHLYWKKKMAEGTDIRSLVQMDMVHPNVEGYRLMAEAIRAEFARGN